MFKLHLNLKKPNRLNDVFTPGGQPSITYNDRKHLGLEDALDKAIALPNTIVSLTGATKSGKTVLCKTVLLSNGQFVWIDGGEVKSVDEIWNIIRSELKLASELQESDLVTTQVGSGLAGEASIGALGTHLKLGITASGSALSTKTLTEKHLPNGMRQCIEYLLTNETILVIDDFHYMPEAARADFIRAIKAPVFRGLKVVLLSTPHRAFQAIDSEPEITGRFKHVTVPDWSVDDLKLIGKVGFAAMGAKVASSFTDRFATEAEGSPLLMQSFCWNLCYDHGAKVEMKPPSEIKDIDVGKLFSEVAADAGLPIYEKLSKGPQSRTDRIRRPLIGGGDADIYEAILLAIARTGPKVRLTYDQIRTSLNAVLSDRIPQKIEVSNALKQLATISTSEAEANNRNKALDWDADNLNIFITDPFFRFYMRWQIANNGKP